MLAIVKVTSGLARVVLGEDTVAAAALAAAASASAAAAAASASAAATSATAAAAAGNGVGAGKDQVDYALPADRNRHDFSRGQMQYLVNGSTGVVSSFGSNIYYATDFIPVTPAVAMYVSIDTYGDGTRGYAWYDSAKTFLSGSTSAVTAGTAITPPASARFVRFSLPGTRASSAIITQSAAPTAWKDFAMVDGFTARKIARDLARSTMPDRNNLYVRNKVSKATLLNQANVTSTDVNYFLTGYMPINSTYGLATNLTFVPGNGSYGWCFYDKDGAFLASNAANANVTTTSGSTSITVNSFSNQGFMVGAPIQGTGIPANTYITGLPAGGYTAAGTYTISQAATASGTVTVTAGGYLPGVAIVPPATLKAALARVSAPTSGLESMIVVEGLYNPTDTSRGFIGWREVERTMPWAGKKLATLGDSIMNDATGNNQFQLGLEERTGAYGSIFSGVSGRKIREQFDGATGGYTRGPTTFWTSSDVAAIDLMVSNCGTNDFGVYSGGQWLGGNPIGSIGVEAVASTANTSTTVTITAAVAGSLAVGMPLMGAGIPAGATITALGTYNGSTGTVTISAAATATASNVIVSSDDRWLPVDFTATITNGSATLNVTTAFRGTLAVGQPIRGTGIPVGTKIASFGTGTGGLGTYTMSAAATSSSSSLALVGGTLHGDLYDIFIRKALAWNGNMTVALFTPLPRYDQGATGNPVNDIGVRLSDYADAILAFGARYSIPVYDLYRRSGLTPAHANSTYFNGNDGLHPSGGYAKFLPGVAKFLNSLA